MATKQVTLREVCESIKINPKYARKILRKAARDNTITFRDEGPKGEPGEQWNERWVFTPAQAKKVAEILAPPAN